MTIISEKVKEAKSWWKSKTIIGTLIMIIPTIIRVIKPELVVDLGGAVNEVWTAAEILANTGDQIWASIMEVVGVVIAVYGRIVAKLGLKL